MDFIGKVDFCGKWAQGHPKALKWMEFHWFYKAWRIRAARGRKREKVAEIEKTFLHFQ